jgi:hypothetical protein
MLGQISALTSGNSWAKHRLQARRQKQTTINKTGFDGGSQRGLAELQVRTIEQVTPAGGGL